MGTPLHASRVKPIRCKSYGLRSAHVPNTSVTGQFHTSEFINIKFRIEICFVRERLKDTIKCLLQTCLFQDIDTMTHRNIQSLTMHLASKFELANSLDDKLCTSYRQS